MQPIVNGLEQEYSGSLAFDRVDANAKSGGALLRKYGLRGHPSYVIVDENGTKRWSATGVLDKLILIEAIEEFKTQ